MPNLTHNNRIISYDENSKECPHCHYSIEPKVLAFTVIGNANKKGDLLEIAMICVRRECLRMFISTYVLNSLNIFSFRSSKPMSFIAPNVTEQVKELSPTFVEIYNQACAAEAQDLDQISGVGYRKALEFLIKDYCISKNQDKEESIKELALAKVIGQYVEDINIKECARRAIWLGNDETHYVRKFEAHDVDDLKVLITLTMSWITSCILTSHYLLNMENRKKQPS